MLKVKKQTISFGHREHFNKYEVKQHASLPKEDMPVTLTGNPPGKDTPAAAGSLGM